MFWKRKKNTSNICLNQLTTVKLNKKEDLDFVFVFGYNYLEKKDTFIERDEFLFIVTYLFFVVNLKENSPKTSINFVTKEKEFVSESVYLTTIFYKNYTEKGRDYLVLKEDFVTKLMENLHFKNKDYYKNYLLTAEYSCFCKLLDTEKEYTESTLPTVDTLQRKKLLVFKVTLPDLTFKGLDLSLGEYYKYGDVHNKDKSITQTLVDLLSIKLPYKQDSFDSFMYYMFDNKGVEPKVNLLMTIDYYDCTKQVIQASIEYQLSLRNQETIKNIVELANDFYKQFERVLKDYNVAPEHILPIVYLFSDTNYFEKVYQLVQVLSKDEYLSLPIAKQEELNKTYVDKVFLTDVLSKQNKNADMLSNILDDLINN